MRQQKPKWRKFAQPAVLVPILGLALALSVRFHDAGGAASSSAPGVSDPYDRLPMEVSVAMLDRGQVPVDEGSYEHNRWTEWIERQSRVKLTVVPVPRNEAGRRLNTLIAAGEAPDLIWEYDRNYIGSLVAQDALQPLDDYIDKYSTVLKAYIRDNPDLLPYMTFNGKIYGLTTRRTPDLMANGGLWIRQDWLDRVGMKAPTTEEEFFGVLKSFQESGLAGRADAPVVSLHAHYNNVFQSLYSTHRTQWYMENGTMTNARFVDRVADELMFERKLYANGYIDIGYLTDINMQRSMADWSAGRTGVLIGNYGPAVALHMKELLENVPEAKPVPLEPFATKYGKAGMYQETPALMYVAFNKKMNNPKVAIRYLDWMMEEGWSPLLNGFENEHYKLVNGIPQMLDDSRFEREVAYAGEYAIVRNYAAAYRPESGMAAAAQDPVSQRWAKLMEQSLEVALRNPFRRDIPFSPSMPEIQDVLGAVGPQLAEIRTRAVIAGDITPGTALDQMRREWRQAGGERVDQLVQMWYEYNKGSWDFAVNK
ncbi:extracellular solute-binding protein [Paenibacillus oceani]|uniref:Extracellular solute-binding protein n=1 Tax=Paenibacillus oceani TaxID=2772510 RepID=A0A927CFH2_9BACL|nr:extracellular solute-binding protein [Paenibacillus oceani]MBD2865642.1 extracellular solute-binding protein [Paenibacillus oceani]